MRKRILSQKMIERHVVERGDASIYFTLFCVASFFVWILMTVSGRIEALVV